MEQLVRNIYRDVLMRQPTAAELNAALTQLNGGTRTGEFVAALVNSPECIEIVQPVAGIYGALFGRTPDKAGLEFWVAQHRAVQSLDVPDNVNPNTGNPLFDDTFGREALISTIKLMVNPDQTSEFAQKYGAGSPSGQVYLASDLVTDTVRADTVGLTGKSISRGPSAEDFVDGLYFNILGREPDAAGRAFWIGAYNGEVNATRAGGSKNPENDARAFIIDRFVDSDEFQNVIGSYLVDFLEGAGQDPDPTDHYADPNDLENSGSLGNDAPEIDSVTATVAENSSAGTVVSRLTVTDRDFNDTATFTMVDPSGLFEIIGDSIEVREGADIDFETAASHEVEITATDPGPDGEPGLSDTKTITITVTDVVENSAPTLVTTAGTVVEGASAGARAATLVSTDPDSGDAETYSIDDPSGLFEVNGDEIVVKAGAVLDFETAESFDIEVTVTDSAGLADTGTVTITVADINEAPFIASVTGSANENAVAGTGVAALTVTDPEGDVLSLEIVDLSGFFEISQATNNIVVRSGAKIDFEDERVFVVSVTATDPDNLEFSRNVTINVNDVNEAPSIAPTTGAVLENASAGTVVAALDVSDPDEGDTPTLTLTDPSGNFGISGSNIVVNTGASIDFETNQSFVVVVSATDGDGLQDTEIVTITVQDSQENVAPILAPASGAVEENAAPGTAVVTLSSTDGNAGDTAVYSIVDTSGNFQVNGNRIDVRAGANLDFETTDSFSVEATVTDSGGLSDTKTVVIAVTDRNEAPTLSVQSGSVDEGAEAGTEISAISATDPDEGDTVTFSLSDPSGLFEIVDGKIAVKSGANVDFETSSSHTVQVTAIDGGGLTDTESVTITVNDVIEPLTINLTTNTDAPGASPPAADTQGGPGADTFNGLVRASDGTSTLNPNDVLAGGDADDTLNVRIIDTPATNPSITSTSIENVFFRLQPGDENAFATIDMATADDVERVVYADSPGDPDSIGDVFLHLLNVGAGSLEAIGLQNSTGNFFVDVTGRSGRQNSDDDAIALELDGAFNTELNVLFDMQDEFGSVDQTFEIINIDSTNSQSRVQLFNPLTLTTVNATGDARVILTEAAPSSSTGNFHTLKTVDASGMSAGGIDIDARFATATDFSFLGGEADDRVVLDRSVLETQSNTVAIDGGGGRDTLATTTFNFPTGGVGLATINGATGIEVLESVLPTSSLDMSEYTSIKEFVFSGSSTTTQINIREVENDNLTVFAADISSGNAPTIRFEGDTAGTTVSMELRGTFGAGGEVRLVKSAGSSGNDESTIDFQNVSAVKIHSTGENDAANVITAVADPSFDRFAFDNENVPNFMITGDQDLTIAAEPGVPIGFNRDVRGFKEAVNVDASAFTGDLRIAGSNLSDAITGGSGDDIMYVVGDGNVFTGNGGTDQYRITSVNETDNELKDFIIGEDKIAFFYTGNGTQEGIAFAPSEYVQNRSQISQISSADDNKIIELQGELSTGQIEADTGGTAFAFVAVFNSTTSKGELWFDDDWSTGGDRKKILTFDTFDSLSDLTGLSNTDFLDFVF